MNCKEIDDLLSPYLDGELDSGTQQAVFRHLNECPDCHYEMTRIRKLIKMLSSLEEIDPPEDFSKKLSRRILEIAAAKSKKEKRYGLSPQSWLPFGAAAAVIIALVFSLNLWPAEEKVSDMPLMAVSPQAGPALEKAPGVLSVDKMGGTAFEPTAEAEGLKVHQIQAEEQINAPPLPTPLPDPAKLIEKWVVSVSDIGEGYSRITTFLKNISWNVVTLKETPKEIILSLEGNMKEVGGILSYIKNFGELAHTENILPRLSLAQDNIIKQPDEIHKTQPPQEGLAIIRIEIHIISK